MNRFFHKFKVNNFIITVKLPKTYFREKDYFYPMLCVQDGDYLFKNIKKDIIFIGIESNQRSNDFTPWQSHVGMETNGGNANEYLRWLTEELIPYLRQIYRISSDNKDIGISGASYGALVSLYALYKTPNFFGNYILISPSVWYPDFINFMKKNSVIQEDISIYWYVGLKEGIKHTLMIKNMVQCSFEGNQIVRNQLNNEKNHFKFQTYKHGIHRHRYFKRYFKKALKFMYN